MTTPSSLYTQTVLADGPVAYYRMDETSGTTVHDLTGHGNTGTLSGSYTLGQEGVFVGDPDSAIAFGGTTGTLSFPPSLFVGNWQALSLEFWIQGPSTLWQYIAITANITATSLYLQGKPYGSGTGSDITLVSALLDWVGSYQASSLDEVALYNKLLTPTQIATHFAEAPLMPLTPPPDASPYMGGVVGAATLPLKQIVPRYQVSGTLLIDQPYLATAPAPLPNTSLIPAGTPFTLFFQSPTSGTQTLLASGKTVSLTFGLANGKMVAGSVHVNSTLTGSIFLVECTLTQTVIS